VSAPGAPDVPRTGLVVARVAAGVLLVGGALLVLRPFLTPLAWASIIAYTTWPLFKRMRRWTRAPRVTAVVFTAVVLFGVGVPVAWLLVALANEGSQLVARGQQWLAEGARLPQWIVDLPMVGPEIEELRSRWLANSGELLGYFTRYGTALSNQLVGLAGGIGRNLFSFLIMLVSLFAMYVDGERITAQARRLATAIFPHTSRKLVDDIGAVTKAVVFGLVGTAIAQGVLCGVGLAVFGVPSPVALGALTSALSFIPAGPVFVWGGAAAWLFMGGHTGAAIGMAAWGVFLVSSLDNVLRPILIGRTGSIRIPFLVVFFGVLGGLAAFGPLGLFLGPVLLSVTFALSSEFPSRVAAAPHPAA
jgi:predicted PurR-regulated permease PerM